MSASTPEFEAEALDTLILAAFQRARRRGQRPRPSISSAHWRPSSTMPGVSRVPRLASTTPISASPGSPKGTRAPAIETRCEEAAAQSHLGGSTRTRAGPLIRTGRRRRGRPPCLRHRCSTGMAGPPDVLLRGLSACTCCSVISLRPRPCGRRRGPAVVPSRPPSGSRATREQSPCSWPRVVREISLTAK